MNKIHWSDLTGSEKMHYVTKVANGCGPGWSPWLRRFLNTYFFGMLFKAYCDQHDFNFDRGGGVWDYIKANWYMVKFTFIDFYSACLIALRAFIFVCVGLIYLASITLLGWLSFRFTAMWSGNYRTKEEILQL